MVHDWGYGFAGGWLGWLGPILMIVFWVLVIVGLVFLIRWLFLRSAPPNQRNSALDILKVRYARGELSRKEFEQMKQDLL
jgi:putative membrane protein